MNINSQFAKTNIFLLFNSSNIAIWSSVLFFVISTTNILSFWKPFDTQFDLNVDSGNKINQIIGILVLIVSLLQLSSKQEQFVKLLKGSLPLIILFFYSAISCSWSEAPFIAFRRWLKIGIMPLCICNLITEDDDGYSLIKFIYYYISIVLVASLIAILVPPQFCWGWMRYEGHMVARGIVKHKSGFGDFCVSAFFLLQWIKICSCKVSATIKKKSTILSIMAIIFLLLSQGKNPLLSLSVTLIICICILFYIKTPLVAISVILFAIASTLVYLFLRLNSLVGSLLEFVVHMVGKDMTFTGRKPLWESLIMVGLEKNPFFGSGIESFFLGQRSIWLRHYIAWEASSAHSGYVKIFLELGIVGLIIFIICSIITFFMLLTSKNINRYELSILLSMFIYTLIFNVGSDTFFNLRLSFMIYILTILYSSYKHYQSLRIN